MSKEKSSAGEREEAGTYVTQIRMADNLSDRLKKRAGETGASLNSTMCLLLDLALNISERTIIIHQKE